MQLIIICYQSEELLEQGILPVLSMIVKPKHDRHKYCDCLAYEDPTSKQQVAVYDILQLGGSSFRTFVSSFLPLPCQ